MPESTLTQQKALDVLRTVIDPELHRDIVSLGMVKEVLVQGNDVSLEIVLTTPACPMKDKLNEDIRLAFRGNLPQVGTININFSSEVRSSRPMSTIPSSRSAGPAPGPQSLRLPGVKNVIAVGSGKGGVGKSTVAVNLALALKQEGASVGLLDTDIYGPSIPIMCGVKEDEKPKVAPGNRIIPIQRFGIPLMSMGFLMKAQDAVVWRGPMLSKMLQQFLEQVEWGQLDYLVLDLPPGTGDVQLSLSQLIPLSGAVVVTTPQDVALADVTRAIKMFQMTHIPLLGIVENMSVFECPHCHEETPIFGKAADKEKYAGLGVEWIGSLPLEAATRTCGDEGEPIVVRAPLSRQAERFRAIARQVAGHLSVANLEAELELPNLQSTGPAGHVH